MPAPVSLKGLTLGPRPAPSAPVRVPAPGVAPPPRPGPNPPAAADAEAAEAAAEGPAPTMARPATLDVPAAAERPVGPPVRISIVDDDERDCVDEYSVDGDCRELVAVDGVDAADGADVDGMCSAVAETPPLLLLLLLLLLEPTPPPRGRAEKRPPAPNDPAPTPVEDDIADDVDADVAGNPECSGNCSFEGGRADESSVAAAETASAVCSTTSAVADASSPSGDECEIVDAADEETAKRAPAAAVAVAVAALAAADAAAKADAGEGGGGGQVAEAVAEASASAVAVAAGKKASLWMTTLADSDGSTRSFMREPATARALGTGTAPVDAGAGATRAVVDGAGAMCSSGDASVDGYASVDADEPPAAAAGSAAAAAEAAVAKAETPRGGEARIGRAEDRTGVAGPPKRTSRCGRAEEEREEEAGTATAAAAAAVMALPPDRARKGGKGTWVFPAPSDVAPNDVAPNDVAPVAAREAATAAAGEGNRMPVPTPTLTMMPAYPAGRGARSDDVARSAIPAGSRSTSPEPSIPSPVPAWMAAPRRRMLLSTKPRSSTETPCSAAQSSFRPSPRSSP